MRLCFQSKFSRTLPWVVGSLALTLFSFFTTSANGQAAPLDLSTASPELARQMAALPTIPGAGLFIPVPAARVPLAAEPNAPTIARSRLAAVDPAYLSRLLSINNLQIQSGRVLSTSRNFVLNLFDDVQLNISKTGGETDSIGNRVVKGIVTGNSPGTATIVVAGSTVVGNIVVGSRHYGFFPTATSGQRIVEYRDASLPPHPVAPRPPPPPPNPGFRQPLVIPAPTPGPTKINLLIVYTNKSSALLPDIQASVSLAMSDLTATLSKSQLNISFNVVGIVTTEYSEADKTSNQVLDDLKTGSGGFAEIHNARNSSKADLVSVWADVSDACGLGYQNDNTDDPNNGVKYYSAYGYSVLSTHFLTDCISYDMTHEIGHNLGAAHDRFVETPNIPGPQGYNYGYVDLVGKFRDTMAYEDACTKSNIVCPRVQYFSNPNVMYNGRPTGAPDNSSGAADASRRIRELSPLVGEFHNFPAQ